MGKKSKQKKQRIKAQANASAEQVLTNIEENRPFLVNFIFFGVLLSLFSPLILNNKFYFPFVGPKSLFFMAMVEIVFFAWLFLILNYKQYRPKINSILIALILFLFVLILSSIFGADLSRSFWSKFERMTGLLMWLHLFAFFLVISSTFKTLNDWKKIFIVSIFVSILISSFALLELTALKMEKDIKDVIEVPSSTMAVYKFLKNFNFSQKQGATLGNTSFLGTYVLFNAFLAIWLFFQQKHWMWKIYSGVAVVLGFLAIYLSEANAATLCLIGGIGLIFLLWLGFKIKFAKIRILGKTLLIISTITVITGLILTFIPNNFVYDHLYSKIKARYVNWEIAKLAFWERPLFGWGPENYILIFPKYFNPCLFTGECGGEIWFDRTHNIIFDTLVTIGVFGLVFYIGLFLMLFCVLIKKYLKERSIDFWTFSIFITIPIAYLIQNLTVFDMVASLMMFFIILGFIGSLANLNLNEREKNRKFIPSYKWRQIIPIFFIFSFSFYSFIIQPLRTDALVIEAIQSRDVSKKIELYQKTLNTSPIGKYQIREFFAGEGQNIIERKRQELVEFIRDEKIDETTKKRIKEKVEDEIKMELDFFIKELNKTEKESPLDYRSILRLSNLYNIYSMFDSSKILLAEQYGKKSLELSPTNQQGYWVLAQTKIYQGDFKAALELANTAINLEPKYLWSHQVAVRVAQIFGDSEKAKELAKKAIEINPDWQEVFKQILDK